MIRNVKWPVFIIALLLGHVTAMIVLIYKSSGAGAHQVIPDYYQKALHWDRHLAQETTNRALGWKVSLAEISSENRDHRLKITISDREGRALSDMAIKVFAFHKAHASETLTARAHAEGDTYFIDLPIHRSGIWELQIEAQKENQTFKTTLDRELFVERTLMQRQIR